MKAEADDNYSTSIMDFIVVEKISLFWFRRVEMITVQHIHKKFGDKVALDNISFDIQEGQIFGFLGPSGSGKTTMIKIITGQVPADSGKSYLLGKESPLLSP